MPGDTCDARHEHAETCESTRPFLRAWRVRVYLLKGGEGTCLDMVIDLPTCGGVTTRGN